MNLLYGIILVFLIAFFLVMISISVNQHIVSRLQSNLDQNYPTLKYNHEMLAILDELNAILIEDRTPAEKDSIIFKPELYLHEFEKRMQLHISSSTKGIELELIESLNNAFRRFSKSVTEEEYVSNYRLYKERFLNLRQYVLNIQKIKFRAIKLENEEITGEMYRVMNIQKKAGITGIVIIGLIVFLLPLFVFNKIENLTEKLLDYYQSRFHKEIELEAGKQLERLEEVVNKILMEVDDKFGNI